MPAAAMARELGDQASQPRGNAGEMESAGADLGWLKAERNLLPDRSYMLHRPTRVVAY